MASQKKLVQLGNLKNKIPVVKIIDEEGISHYYVGYHHTEQRLDLSTFVLHETIVEKDQFTEEERRTIAAGISFVQNKQNEINMAILAKLGIK